MPVFNPWKGDQVSLAWGAAYDILSSATDWTPHDSLINRMVEVSDMTKKSAANLLLRARDYGVITRFGTYDQQEQKDYRLYRLIPETLIHPSTRLWVRRPERAPQGERAGAQPSPSRGLGKGGAQTREGGTPPKLGRGGPLRKWGGNLGAAPKATVVDEVQLVPLTEQDGLGECSRPDCRRPAAQKAVGGGRQVRACERHAPDAAQALGRLLEKVKASPGNSAEVLYL